MPMPDSRLPLRLVMACSYSAVAAAVSVFLLMNVASAADPVINSNSPYGLQRGTEATLTFNGNGLANVKEILFYTAGFTVKSLEAKDDASLKAVVAVAPDCELGIHAIRMRSTTGISNLRTFTVGHLSEVQEKEPNNNVDQPQAVPLNVTVSGVVQTEDTDFYTVELKKGERLNVELEGLRLGNTFFDPYLSILGPDKTILTKSDDSALLNQDCLCSLIAPQDGKYTIQLREIAFGGSGACTYRMHVGTFPRPTAVFPPGGKPGEKLTLHWLGDPAGEFEQEFTLPTDGKPEARVVAHDGHSLAPSPNVLRVSDLPWSNEQEPNDEIKTASATSASPVPFAAHGVIAAPGDVDYCKFAAKKGQQLDVRVFARKPIRSPLDAMLAIHNAQGGTIANNDDTGGPDSYVRVTVPADGDYYFSIRDQLKAGGPEFVYRVEITEVKPALVMRLPEQRRYISTTLVVPQNNRNAVMVAAQRQNFAGELNVSFENLPAGMTAESVSMAAAMSEVPVILSAAEGAPPAGALLGIIGKTTDPKLNVVGNLDQRTMLVRGQNNVDVWGHNADRMATVLAEAIPYTLELVPPAAPLVRNGSLDLKVVAKRAEGFTAPISLRMLYNPPGVASSGSIVIPEGKSEAVIPLTANNGAGLGTWKIVVTGRTGRSDARGNRNYNDETLRCSTQFAELTIGEPYFKFAFAKTAVEQGKETEVVVKVQKLRDFGGKAKVELVGLPANTKATPVEFTQDDAELKFKVTAEKNAKPGRYTSLVCVSKFPYGDDVVTHTLAGGELRIDSPLPAKK
jgi:hypothetical protein